MKTLSQSTMQQALDLVREVGGKSERVRTIYGNLCHEFPVLVRTCGLCQAIAFCADKAQSDEKARAEAYRLLLQHIGKILGVETDGNGGADDPLLKTILQAGTTEYMLHTRRVLQAWVYFKRFAVSVLGVKTGGSES
ncbi:MAG: type III-B CRISPR module-associated protein Cmr5 [Armatimonadetes bacterium]|nr:type III-B CRISPR module-associated protein Cmr5 [Armatimonadota bacterium]